ncbi:hypothetical protein [Fervidibacter sp.]
MRRIFRQFGSTALQKTIRYSLLATRCRFRLGRKLALPQLQAEIRRKGRFLTFRLLSRSR